jgi:phospholipid/cholesterol/gamma-HCH transport system permease protein
LNLDPARAAHPPDARPGPLRVLDPFFGALAYLGGAAILGASAVGSIGRRAGREGLARAVVRRLDPTFAMGVPLVGLIHVGFGSFLSMQAFYGATFREASGAVVGLGLVRNVAPLLTGFTMAGLMAVWITGELAGGLRPGLDDDPADVPDRDVRLGRAPDPRPSPTPGRLALVRILAAMVAGPILTAWGALVGTLIGAAVCQAVLGVPFGIYFGLFRQMLGVSDVMGVIVKGMLYGGLSALVACHEGLRPRSGAAPPAFRAMIASMLIVLTINLCWFELVYMSGHPFGPELGDAAP